MTLKQRFGENALAKAAWHFVQVLRCRCRYARHIRRIRCKVSRGEKIRVLFILSEVAKWKEQLLLEEMNKAGVFEPIVALSAWNRQLYLPDDKVEDGIVAAEAYFAALGDKCVRVVTFAKHQGRQYSDLKEFSPDVVYFTEPWHPAPGQTPFSVSEIALTSYTPYYVPNYGPIDQECQLSFHRYLHSYFCMSQSWVTMFRSVCNPFTWMCGFVPSGHPAMDYFVGDHEKVPKRPCVIYAPHFSIPHAKHGYLPQYYATFDWNGREILAYAKSHPEIEWEFKPHPLLRGDLVKIGFMGKEEVDAYYAEWERIGRVSYDASYQNLFFKSSVMITDCGSFLTEYAATGRPIIHLICAKNVLTPTPVMKRVYDTYYRVHDLDEMYATFKTVIEDGQDPHKAERLAAVRDAGIANSNASKKIVAYYKKLFKV